VEELFGEVTSGAAVVPANASTKLPSTLRLLAICGKAGAGKVGKVRVRLQDDQFSEWQGVHREDH
jgi:hypothetical protein